MMQSFMDLKMKDFQACLNEVIDMMMMVVVMDMMMVVVIVMVMDVMMVVVMVMVMDMMMVVVMVMVMVMVAVMLFSATTRHSAITITFSQFLPRPTTSYPPCIGDAAADAASVSICKN